MRATADVLDGHFGSGARRRHWFIAREEGRPFGLCLLNTSPDGTSAELAYFGVAPSARGRGIAKALLATGLHACSTARISTVTLAVDSRNLPAKRLYDAHGFRKTIARVALVQPRRASPAKTRAARRATPTHGDPDCVDESIAARLSRRVGRERIQNLFASPHLRRDSSAVYPQESPEASRFASIHRKPRDSRQFRIEAAKSFFTRLEQFRSRSTVRIARRDAGLRNGLSRSREGPSRSPVPGRSRAARAKRFASAWMPRRSAKSGCSRRARHSQCRVVRGNRSQFGGGLPSLLITRVWQVLRPGPLCPSAFCRRRVAPVPCVRPARLEHRLRRPRQTPTHPASLPHRCRTPAP
ncbi:MAG: GNAT family N-acetyltransferase [bacterium]